MEPIVAEAAAQVLHGQNMVLLLTQNMSKGLIEKGQRGELVACLLLTLAHNRVLERLRIPHRDNQGQFKKLYISPIPVIAFSREWIEKRDHDFSHLASYKASRRGSFKEVSSLLLERH